jgi:hypothetical protein
MLGNSLDPKHLRLSQKKRKTPKKYGCFDEKTWDSIVQLRSAPSESRERQRCSRSDDSSRPNWTLPDCKKIAKLKY